MAVTTKKQNNQMKIFIFIISSSCNKFIVHLKAANSKPKIEMNEATTVRSGGRMERGDWEFIALFITLFCFESDTPVSDVKQNG